MIYGAHDHSSTIQKAWTACACTSLHLFGHFLEAHLPCCSCDHVIARTGIMPAYRLLHQAEPARRSTRQRAAASPVWVASSHGEEVPTLPGVKTLYDLFTVSATKYPSNACLGFRRIVKGVAMPYEFITYKEVSQRVAHVAAAFKALGLKAEDRVSVLGPNCPEWMLAMQACNRMSLVCVPLYETLGDDAIEFIIDHSSSSLVAVAGKRAPGLIRGIRKLKKSSLKTVVHWGDIAPKDLEELCSLGLKVLSWTELENMGKAKPAAPQPPKPSDLSTIMYTSGTTGDPKGVMITHGNLVSDIASCNAYLALHNESLGVDDCYFSFLPLAHVFDRVAEEFMLSKGGSIGYWQGEIPKVLDDIGALHPTLFCGVPRVFDRIYAGIQDQLKANPVKRLFFRLAFAWKSYWMKLGWRVEKASPLADALVFKNIKQRLGGRVRLVLSGAAPLARHVQEFLSVAMCAPVLQGYGLTETCAASFIAEPFTWAAISTVGAPLPGVQLRLEAVPDMGYSPDDESPAGEVCIRGPAVFKGYYLQEEMTADAIDAEGFFHTGDIGRLAPSGALRIVDRKKNIFKLAQGEYVAVEKVESVLKSCPLVEQVWVYGNSFESCLVAVVVPNEKALLGWAKGAGVPGDFAALCGSAAVQKHLVAELAAVGKMRRLQGFELVKAVHLETAQFSVDNDLMTPTFKLKRVQLLKHYQSQVDDLYAHLRANTRVQGLSSLESSKPRA